MKIVYLCSRLGPYHFACLNAANNHAEIIALEYSAMDHIYAWDVIEDPSRFQRVTLFKDKPITMQPLTTITKRMRSVLDNLRPQVVAIMGWSTPAALIALRWCLESKIPTIMMSDSLEHDKPRVWWKEFTKGRIVRLASAGFVAGTSHISYLKSLGMAEEAIVTGCDVVDNDYFERGSRAARQNSASLRNQYSLPEHYFLVSCRFIPVKNLFAVLRAYSIYLQNSGKIPWKLVLLGDGVLKAQIMNLREELGLAEMVLLPGFIQFQELPVYYGLSEALILASTSETWGLVVNEAMASKLPVIVSSRCGCAVDLVTHGHNGFIFDPHDINALAKYLTYVASNECDRNTMGNESYRIIKGWNLSLFANNLCKAADLALKAPEKIFNNFDKGLMWSLIHKLHFSK